MKNFNNILWSVFGVCLLLWGVLWYASVHIAKEDDAKDRLKYTAWGFLGVAALIFLGYFVFDSSNRRDTVVQHDTQ